MNLPREGSRTIREGIIVSEPMDWCKSPSAIVPYKIYTHCQIEGANTADSVRQTDERSHVKGSLIRTCYGDEPGVGGGVKSGTHNAECTPKTWSETVRFEDRNAVRHDDEWWMNHKNTWGRLTYIKDPKDYETPEQKQIEPKMQWAALRDPNTAVDASPPQGAGAEPAASAGDGRMQLARGPMVQPPVRTPVRPTAPSIPSPTVTVPSGPYTLPVNPSAPTSGPAFEKDRFETRSKGLPDRVPEMRAAPGSSIGPHSDDDVRIAEGKCKKKEIYFNRNGFKKTEYQRQLDMQAVKLNRKGACKSKDDIDAFNSKSKSDKETDRKDAEREQKKFRRNWLEEDPSRNAKGQAALHRLDMVVDGDKLDIADMGDQTINSSIGSQWNTSQANSLKSRQQEAREHADKMCQQKCPLLLPLFVK